MQRTSRATARNPHVGKQHQVSTRSWPHPSSVEDHFLIDEAFRLLGPLIHEENVARDYHDRFNLVALLFLCVVNLRNWNLSALGAAAHQSWVDGIALLFTGHHSTLFYNATFAYFVVDTLWVKLLPHSVKSPGTIVNHHVMVLAYMVVLVLYPNLLCFFSAGMLVEINTWFLIARRVFDHHPVISVAFYVTWVAIRVVLYPILTLVSVHLYLRECLLSPHGCLNVLVVCPVFALCLTYLNFKWTLDLIRSVLNRAGVAKGL